MDTVPTYGEKRDALDQRWTLFLQETGVLAVPVPNCPLLVKCLLDEYRPQGILLTGGNSPVQYGGDAPERDETDRLLIDYGMEKHLPVVGVCRGMQSILVRFGAELEPVAGHVAEYHPVSGMVQRRVNSYHTLGAKQLPQGLLPMATAGDGVVEAVYHKAYPLWGIMWHPERETPFCNDDVEFFKDCWK